MKYGYLFCVFLFAGYAYSMETDPEKVMDKDAKTISVDSIITHINDAIENKDASDLSSWKRRLELLIGMDWKYFDIDQIEKYQEFSSDLDDKTNPILFQRRQNSDRIACLDRMLESITESKWLIDKLQKNECNIEWESLLGQGTKSLPTPETLKRKRIEELEEVGTLKKMHQ